MLPTDAPATPTLPTAILQRQPKSGEYAGLWVSENLQTPPRQPHSRLDMATSEPHLRGAALMSLEDRGLEWALCQLYQFIPTSVPLLGPVSEEGSFFSSGS